MRLDIEDLRHEVSLAQGVKERVQIELFVQARVGVVKEFLPVLALLVALHVLQTAAARAQHPYPPGLPVRVMELGPGAKRLLQAEVRLVFCVAELALRALWGAKIYRPYKRRAETVVFESGNEERCDHPDQSCVATDLTQNDVQRADGPLGHGVVAPLEERDEELVWRVAA